MTRSGRQAPSLFSSSLTQRDAAPTAILAALSGDGRECRRMGSRRVAVMGFRMAAVLAALAAAGYVFWPMPAVEAPRVTEDFRRPATPATVPDSRSPMADALPDVNSAPAHIVVAEVQDPPSQPMRVAAAPRPVERQARVTPTQVRSAAATPAPVTAVTNENRALGGPAESMRITGEDSDVRLLAALMVHAGPIVLPDDTAHRALRDCGVLAPLDREACVAELCRRGRISAAICQVPAAAR